MPEKLCPLILAASPSALESARCRGEDCFWFHKFQDTPESGGLCAIFRIGQELSEINEKISSVMLELSKARL